MYNMSKQMRHLLALRLRGQSHLSYGMIAQQIALLRGTFVTRAKDVRSSSSIFVRRVTRSGARYCAPALCLGALLISGCGMSLSNGATGGIQVNPSSIDYGNVTVGQSSSQPATISNSSSGAITVSQVSVSGQGFSVTGLPSFPVSIAAGQSISVQVVFKPSAAGAATGTLSVVNTSPSAGVTNVPLSGSGQAATSTPNPAQLSGLSCSSSSITGTGSDNCTVTLSASAGSGGLSVALTSSNSAVTLPATVNVASGSSSATFTAQAASVTSNQSVTLSATAGSITKTFPLTLYAVNPDLALSSTSLDFGIVSVGSSGTQSLTVTSNGTSGLTINSATISGAGFSVSGASFPLSLTPGNSVTLQVQFSPASAGSYTGTLSLSTNAQGSGTSTVSLSGTGQSGTTSTAYEVQLSWAAPTSATDPVTGYNIYRESGGSSTYQLLNTTPDTSTTYTDTTVANGTTYSYYVESVDAAGNQSGPSNVFTAAIP